MFQDAVTWGMAFDQADGKDLEMSNFDCSK